MPTDIASIAAMAAIWVNEGATSPTAFDDVVEGAGDGSLAHKAHESISSMVGIRWLGIFAGRQSEMR